LSESASELYRPSGHYLSAKLVPTFEDRGCHVVSVTDPYGRILGFLDRGRYFFFQVSLELYSRGWVDLVQDLLLLRKSRSAGNRTRTSGSVARNLGVGIRLYSGFGKCVTAAYVILKEVPCKSPAGCKLRREPNIFENYIRAAVNILCQSYGCPPVWYPLLICSSDVRNLQDFELYGRKLF
jgi:hypothetical protein